MIANRTGSAMSEILNPSNGYRGGLEAKGIKPKNHMAANRAALKQKEEELLKKKEDEMANTKSKSLSDRYFSLTSLII